MKEIDKALAVLGRYGGQSMWEMERCYDVHTMFRRASAVADLIEAENRANRTRP